jgi:hypothetical protein
MCTTTVSHLLLTLLNVTSHSGPWQPDTSRSLTHADFGSTRLTRLSPLEGPATADPPSLMMASESGPCVCRLSELCNDALLAHCSDCTDA